MFLSKKICLQLKGASFEEFEITNGKQGVTWEGYNKAEVIDPDTIEGEEAVAGYTKRYYNNKFPQKTNILLIWDSNTNKKDYVPIGMKHQELYARDINPSD